MTEKNIYEKIMVARLYFLQNASKKSGHNKFKDFDYFELKDIVPVATKICNELGLYTHISIADGKAVMSVINIANPDECVHFKIDAPVMEVENYNLEQKNVYQTMLQNTGAAETYLRRYLYFLFLDITDNDTVDAPDFAPKPNEGIPKSEPNEGIPKSESAKSFSKTAPKTAPKTKKGNGFKTANEVIEEKSASRVIAEQIIKSLRVPNLLEAKKELAIMVKEGDLSSKETDDVLKELEVLLNGTGSKSNS